MTSEALDERTAWVLVGTQKGAFLLSGSSDRQNWSLSGPHLVGAEVFHVTHDPRDDTLLAAVNHPVWGSQVHVSEDLGQTWALCSGQPRFSEERGETIERLWHVAPGRESEPDTWYVGAAPASLFRTTDRGATWKEITSLSQHPTRDEWQPGFGGLCLHSIVLHPADAQRMWVGMSAVGVFGTSDGGSSWHPMNQGVRADFMPTKFPEFGQCTHKLLAHPETPDTLFQQNHCGVYRSDDGGATWTDISAGLPSRFGFVLGLHPHDPQTIYVVPEDEADDDTVGGMKRFVTGAKFRVYRSRNCGQTWETLTRGLPQENAFIHLLREGMATDQLNPAGIYVGTKAGQVFHSRNDGDDWLLLWDNLPPVLSVETATI